MCLKFWGRVYSSPGSLRYYLFFWTVDSTVNARIVDLCKESSSVIALRAFCKDFLSFWNKMSMPFRNWVSLYFIKIVVVVVFSVLSSEVCQKIERTPRSFEGMEAVVEAVIVWKIWVGSPLVHQELAISEIRRDTARASSWREPNENPLKYVTHTSAVMTFLLFNCIKVLWFRSK